MKALVIGVVALVPALAHADCPVDKSVSVTVSCNAELIGGGDGSKVNYGETSKATPLEVGGKLVTLTFGDYRLTGDLSCSGPGNGAKMDWGLRVELTKKKVAGPLAYMHVGVPDASARKGKAPLAVTSYEYLTPGIAHPNKKDKKLTRVDYTCQVRFD